MLRSTIRNGIGTIRIAEHLNARLIASGLPERKTNLNVMVDTGKQCMFAGSGDSFEDFQMTGLLRKFMGFGEKPAVSTDAHYSEAPLHLMNFTDTYDNDKYKKSKEQNKISQTYLAEIIGLTFPYSILQ